MDTALAFNALSGPELKAAILAKIEQALDNTGEFTNNITFPWVKWTFNVGLTVYPKQSTDAAPGIIALGEGQSEGAPDSTDNKDKKHIELSGGEVIDTPNLARIETGLAIPTPAIGAGGVIVDKPVMSPQAKPVAQAKEKPSGTGTASGNTGSGNVTVPSTKQ